MFKRNHEIEPSNNLLGNKRLKSEAPEGKNESDSRKGNPENQEKIDENDLNNDIAASSENVPSEKFKSKIKN